MDTYLALQASTISQHVGIMIYVFEVEWRNMPKDLQYYRGCLAALQKCSPDAAVFILVHKLDLARGSRAQTLERQTLELHQASGDVLMTVFGTSVYDDTTLARACSATDVVLFERTTFLVIGTSSPPSALLVSSPVLSSPSSSAPQRTACSRQPRRAHSSRGSPS